jgi:uncharacterized protein YaaN involved in tellurite resistance
MTSLDAAISLTDPDWKQKMVMLLRLERQRDALVFQEAVTETTNERISRTSQMLQVQALDIEHKSQQVFVDLDVLAKTNSELIETVNGVLQLQGEGGQARAAAEREIAGQMEQRLSVLTAPSLIPTASAS